jgi:hypothetical protein
MEFRVFAACCKYRSHQVSLQIPEGRLTLLHYENIPSGSDKGYICRCIGQLLTVQRHLVMLDRQSEYATETALGLNFASSSATGFRD